ncbi:MAG: T9SS type A sorting domain-containing protein [Sphingobacteriales bacterium JAD_PAG50586_3]|nr:MAG: T9SS type A sorting domain-containing protein [Sphingobacteriales bacterium JAD_PAG50586_3]
MKKFFTLIIILSGLAATAQCPTDRYLAPQFAVTKQSNVVFANAPAIPAVYVSEAVTINEDITMDIFQPVGDTASKRPLIIFAFGGGYIFGTKDDSDIQGLCDYFARRGYVTASINYRKGLNATSNTSAVRAIYRGAQDWSSAVRWFKEFSGTYKVDTNYIFAGGSSAGSFGALHMAYADDSNKPPEANGTGFPTFNPDLGCLSCSGNNYQHSNNVKAVLNCWGAMLDKNFIDAGDKPILFSTHGTADPIVPFNSGSPFSASLLVQSVDGSNPLNQRAQSVGIPTKFIPYPNQGHCVWGICILNAWSPGSPTEFYNPILDSMRVFMYPLLQPTNATITGPTELCKGDTAVYWAGATNGIRKCWQVTGGEIIDQTPNGGAIKVVWATDGVFDVSVIPYSTVGAAGNATHQAVTVSTYPDINAAISQNGDTLFVENSPYTYQWYLEGQAINGANTNTYVISQTGTYTVEITNSGGCSIQSAPTYAEHIIIEEPNGINENAVDLHIYPNPNYGTILIEGNRKVDVAIYNSLGEACNITSIDYQTDMTLIRHNLPPGIYYAKVVIEGDYTA